MARAARARKSARDGADYTPPRGNIKVHCKRANQELELRVKDSGQGIRSELLPSIFEPFVQGEERQASGLGLGLVVVDRLVRLHGGRVSVESDGEGLGSEFIVRLPLIAQTGSSATR